MLGQDRVAEHHMGGAGEGGCQGLARRGGILKDIIIARIYLWWGARKEEGEGGGGLMGLCLCFCMGIAAACVWK